MNTDTLFLPQSLFWTLEGGLGLTLLLLLWVAQAVRRWHDGPTWRLLLAMGLVIALALIVAACQLGTFTSRSFEASMLFNVALLGLVLAGALHLLVSCLWPRPQLPPTVRPPTPPLTQQHRREARRWKH
jgi:hypothetical protein